MTVVPLVQSAGSSDRVNWPIAVFNRCCHVFAMLWIVGSLFVSFRASPVETKSHEYHDFSQFYMGGLIARHAAWGALYPIPRADSPNSPGAWEDSDPRPEYRRLAKAAGVPEQSSRYIQPPPFALMLEPLAILKYHAAKRAWNLIMALCAWGVAWMAGKSYEIVAQRPSPLAGAIAAFVAVSPLTLETLRLMNVSPFIALLIGWAALGLTRRRSEGGAVALAIGAAAKYATAPLLPLYIAMRKWRALAVMLVFTVALLALCIAVMGWNPFAVYFKEMLPTFGRTETYEWNRSAFALLMRVAHQETPHGIWLAVSRGLQWGSLLGLLALLFTRPMESWTGPACVLAGAAALLCWFLIFSPIVWDHYFFYLVPLWGWLVWEGRRSIVKGVAVAGVILYQSLPGMALDMHIPALRWHGERMTLAGPYECFPLITVLVILSLAVSRLLAPARLPEQIAAESQTHFTFTTAQFNRVCGVLAALWLAVIVPISLSARSLGGGDFAQFYMGGVMARLHAWDSLYPIPTPGSLNNPGMPEDSTMRPRYAAEAEARGVGDAPRFIQAPPVALLLMPLGYLSFSHAFKLWIALLIASGWGVGLLAGRVYRLLRGEPSRISGLLMLAVACSPLMLHAIRVANMTVPVALLIGVTLLGLLKRRDTAFGVACALGGITKYATLCLLPLAVAMRRWAAIGWTCFLVGALFAASYGIMHETLFKTYLHEIFPTLGRTHDIETNQSITAFLTHVLRRPALPAGIRWAVIGGEFVLLVGLLAVLLRRPRADWSDPSLVCAGAAALLCAMLLFSPIYWEHYPTYLCPMWGWMIWEAGRSVIRWMWIIAAIGLMYVPMTYLLDLNEPFNSHILFGTVLTLGFAVWRLASNRSMAAAPSSKESAIEDLIHAGASSPGSPP